MNKADTSKKFVIIDIIVSATIGIIFSKTTGTSGLGKSSEPLAIQILQEQYNLSRSYDDATITRENGNNTYRTKVISDNGSAININIEYYPKKNRIYAEILHVEVLMLN